MYKELGLIEFSQKFHSGQNFGSNMYRIDILKETVRQSAKPICYMILTNTIKPKRHTHLSMCMHLLDNERKQQRRGQRPLINGW